jgi:hypothetical protein
VANFFFDIVFSTNTSHSNPIIQSIIILRQIRSVNNVGHLFILLPNKGEKNEITVAFSLYLEKYGVI